jgi:uncharacterized protein with NRDE domain
MCLIALALGMHPRWPLVVASNRDEFRSRPAAPLAAWAADNGQPILAGRDLRDRGTWFGVTPSGRVAMLTNVRRGTPQRGARSRGELPTRWLAGTDGIESFQRGITSAEYGGFNLIVGDQRSGQWFYLGNGGDGGGGLTCQPLAPGLYGLSNAALDTPWPKTVRLKDRLRSALDASASVTDLQQHLLTALQNAERAPASALPHTGVSAAMESALSSAWVDMPEGDYGTRCSTVLVAERCSGGTQVALQETTYLAGNTSQQNYSLAW